MPEDRPKRDLIVHICIAPGHRVLDLGAGTLAIMIKQIQTKWNGAITSRKLHQCLPDAAQAVRVVI